MKNFPRSELQIGRAKKAQAKRLGQSGAFGKRKRCKKGKSCGASCIANYKVCMVDLPWVGQTAMSQMRDKILQMQAQPESLPKKKAAPPVIPVFNVPQAKPEPQKFKFKEGKIN